MVPEERRSRVLSALEEAAIVLLRVQARLPLDDVYIALKDVILKVSERDQAHCIRENLWEFDAGEFRFWLNVNVGYLDILDERQQTFVDGDGAFLDLSTRFYNMKGDRIAAHT